MDEETRTLKAEAARLRAANANEFLQRRGMPLVRAITLTEVQLEDGRIYFLPAFKAWLRLEDECREVMDNWTPASLTSDTILLEAKDLDRGIPYRDMQAINKALATDQIDVETECEHDWSEVTPGAGLAVWLRIRGFAGAMTS